MKHTSKLSLSFLALALAFLTLPSLAFADAPLDKNTSVAVKGVDAGKSASSCPCGAPGCPCELSNSQLKNAGNTQNFNTRTGPLKPSPTNPTPPAEKARDGKVKGKIVLPGDKGTLAFGEEGGSGTIIAIVAAKAKPIDINTASLQDFVIIMGIGPQVGRAIVTERSKALFKNTEDFAARICTTQSVDFGLNAIVKVQGNTHAPKAGSQKSAGFKCVAGSGIYETSGEKHQYVGHVTLLR